MFVLSTQPQSIITVIMNSLKLYKSSILRLLPLSFLYALSIIVPNIMIQLGLPETMQEVMIALKSHLLLTLCCSVISLWLLAVMFHQVNQVMHQCNKSYIKSCLNGLIRFPLYFIAGFFFVVISLAGSTLFILPGIYLMVLFIFYFPNIVNEHKSIGESLTYSAQLVWTQWWRTFVVLLPTLLGFIVFFLVEHAGGLPLIYLARFHHTEINPYSHIVAIILITLLNPWLTTTMLCQLHDLKLRKQQKSIA